MMGEIYQVKCCGYITGWTFQASLRAQIRPIHFLIWRPVQASSAIFTLIGQHLFWYTKERSRTVTITLAEQEYVLVKHGDMIGWHAPLGDVIDYKTTTDETSSTYFVTSDMSDMTLGMNYTFNGFQDSGRIYGINSILTSVTPPSFIKLSNKIALKCPMESSHYITTIEVFKSTQVKYNIDGYNPWFSVDEETGEVRTITSLKGNITSDITIVVTSTCDVRATVILTLQCIDLTGSTQEGQFDEHKSPETISQPLTVIQKPVYHMTFRESLTAETVLRIFNSTYMNMDKVICILTSIQPTVPENILYISGDSLLMKSHYNLLYNTTPTIHAAVTCVHGDGSAVEETNVIHVVKDLEPVFENLPALISVSAKHHAVDDTVFQATAVDKEGQTLIFSSVNCSCPFSVNLDGSVTVSSDLRKIIKTSFIIEVFVKDGFNTAGPELLNIVIKDTNHPPHFMNLHPEVIVPENKKGIIITIRSHDQDTHDNTTITWAWEDVAAVRFFIFNIHAKQLQVSTATQLDYEFLLTAVNQTSFSLFVSVNDGALSNTEKIVIHVTDVNEAPKFSVEQINVTCNEGMAGSVISNFQPRMMVFDPDFNEVLVYNLLLSSWSNMFSLNRVTSQLIYSSDYDADPSRLPNHVALLIQVSDSRNLTDVLELNLFIKNVNRAPVVVAPASVSVSEDTPGGTLLFAVTASDWDTSDNINITIICSDHRAHYFNFTEPGSVKLRENASLNFEMTPKFTFQVQAADGHTRSSVVFVVLYVTDVNEPPVSQQDRLFINALEGKAGDCVSTVDLRDIFADPDHDTLTFSLVKQNSTDWFTFVADSRCGWLYLSHDVDVTRETSPVILRVHIAAQDYKNLSAKIEIEIKFHFVNTKPTLPGLPVHVTLFEHISVGDVVHTVVVADEDGDRVTLRYQFRDEVQNSFVSINYSGGEIRLMICPPLSLGQSVHISLVITAFDGEDISEPGLLNMTIVGVNDPPRFPRNEYRFIINETQVGQYIRTQETWPSLDSDPDDKLTFLIAGGMDEDGIILNMSTGEIGVVEGYDIDIEGSCHNVTVLLQVVDSYGLYATTKVIISITDINDNMPVVDNDEETFVIYSNVTRGWRIGQIQASDLDSDKNGVLTFSLIGSSLNDTSDHFFINSRDGWIILKELLAPEDHITIYVAVSDSGWPVNTVVASVHVIVLKSPNETISNSPLQQYSTSKDSANDKKSLAVFVLTSLVVCCIAVIAVLSYQLWKTRKILRTTRPEQGHDAYHEYRFQWVPRQIVEEGHDTDTRNSGSPLSASPSFLQMSVSNQNFQYEPAVLALPQRSHKSCDDLNQAAHTQTTETDNECKFQEGITSGHVFNQAALAAGSTGNELVLESLEDTQEIASEHSPCTSEEK